MVTLLLMLMEPGTALQTRLALLGGMAVIKLTLRETALTQLTELEPLLMDTSGLKMHKVTCGSLRRKVTPTTHRTLHLLLMTHRPLHQSAQTLQEFSSSTKKLCLSMMPKLHALITIVPLPLSIQQKKMPALSPFSQRFRMVMEVATDIYKLFSELMTVGTKAIMNG